ncbi:MAG: hypothetical protein J2P16_12860 [Mycobacterium sp.]|nr:hypothetical protein [Mycobacterium sp.]
MSDEEAETPAGAKHAAPDEEDAAESPADRDGPAPEEYEAESPAGTEAPATETSGGRTFSLYGVASAALGLLSIAVIALGVVTWSAHHREIDDRAYQNHVLRAAANWTGVLINLNAGNVDAGMIRLRGKTVGQFNREFDSAMQPYRAVIQKIPPRSSGRLESVTIQSVYHELGIPPGAQSSPPPLQSPPSGATRTDTVMAVATTVVEPPGGKPETVHWNLQLGVSDVGGTLLISGLRPLR